MKIRPIAVLLIVLAAVVASAPSIALAIRGHSANWG
jgi:hypothetical protein